MFGQMDSELRIAMMHAVEECKELDHRLLGPDHLLLGLLSNVRGTAYKVLGEHGVTYEWARRVVAEKHDDTVPEDDRAAPTEANDNLDEDREALRAIGIDLDKVRDAVRETFGEDITERWGHRRGRRHGGRGHREHGRGRRGAEGGPFPEGFGPGPFGPGGRGRRGPRSRRFTRVTPSMHRVLHEVRSDLRSSHPGPCDDNPRPLAGVVLAAILDSGDPVVAAVVEAADDPNALREAVERLAGRTAV